MKQSQCKSFNESTQRPREFWVIRQERERPSTHFIFWSSLSCTLKIQLKPSAQMMKLSINLLMNNKKKKPKEKTNYNKNERKMRCWWVVHNEIQIQINNIRRVSVSVSNICVYHVEITTIALILITKFLPIFVYSHFLAWRKILYTRFHNHSFQRLYVCVWVFCVFILYHKLVWLFVN